MWNYRWLWYWYCTCDKDSYNPLIGNSLFFLPQLILHGSISWWGAYSRKVWRVIVDHAVDGELKHLPCLPSQLASQISPKIRLKVKSNPPTPKKLYSSLLTFVISMLNGDWYFHHHFNQTHPLDSWRFLRQKAKPKKQNMHQEKFASIHPSIHPPILQPLKGP